MNTEMLTYAEAAYRTERAARHGIHREIARLPRLLVRVLWRPRQIVAVILAVRHPSDPEAVRDGVPGVGGNVDWRGGRA